MQLPRTAQFGPHTVTFAALQPDDAQALLQFVNELSAEDTFVTFSGEVLTLAEEQEFVAESIKKIAAGDRVQVIAWCDGRVVGNSAIERSTALKKRSLHVAEFDISISKQWRGNGIGRALMQHVLYAAVKNIQDIDLIKLSLFGTNERAYKLHSSFGFTEYGRLEGEILHKGAKTSHIYMAVEVAQLRDSLGVSA